MSKGENNKSQSKNKTQLKEIKIMASYYEYFTINVEGDKKTIKSICEAIHDFAPYCDTTCKNGTIIAEDMCKIAGEEDACEFARVIARASNGANFKANGATNCSISDEGMCFEIELKDGSLTLRHSDWYYYWETSSLCDCETYEEYLEEFGDALSEDNFNFVLENGYGYCENGKFVLEPTLIGEFQLEY